MGAVDCGRRRGHEPHRGEPDQWDHLLVQGSGRERRQERPSMPRCLGDADVRIRRRGRRGGCGRGTVRFAREPARLGRRRLPPDVRVGRGGGRDRLPLPHQNGLGAVGGLDAHRRRRNQPHRRGAGQRHHPLVQGARRQRRADRAVVPGRLRRDHRRGRGRGGRAGPAGRRPREPARLGRRRLPPDVRVGRGGGRDRLPLPHQNGLGAVGGLDAHRRRRNQPHRRGAGQRHHPLVQGARRQGRADRAVVPGRLGRDHRRGGGRGGRAGPAGRRPREPARLGRGRLPPDVRVGRGGGRDRLPLPHQNGLGAVGGLDAHRRRRNQPHRRGAGQRHHPLVQGARRQGRADRAVVPGRLGRDHRRGGGRGGRAGPAGRRPREPARLGRGRLPPDVRVGRGGGRDRLPLPHQNGLGAVGGLDAHRRRRNQPHRRGAGQRHHPLVQGARRQGRADRAVVPGRLGRDHRRGGGRGGRRRARRPTPPRTCASRTRETST